MIRTSPIGYRRLLAATALASLALVNFGGVAVAAGPQQLIEEWGRQNTLCRGLSGDSPESQAACASRDQLTRQLKQRGWCYGRQGQMAYQMNWHACGSKAR